MNASTFTSAPAGPFVIRPILKPSLAPAPQPAPARPPSPILERMSQAFAEIGIDLDPHYNF